MKIHIVKKGDTLYLIAQKYNVSQEEIIKLNPNITNSDMIDIGMKIKVPASQSGGTDFMHQHVVQQGDTLWKLSKAWGIPLSDMIKANPQLKNPNVLLTGEVVNIPKPGASHSMHETHMQSVHENSGSGHHPLHPSSVMQGVQGLMGKMSTAPSLLGGKKATGQKPNTMPMPVPTPMPEVEAEQVAPTKMPEPAPMPMPLPEIMPVAEKKYPVYNSYDQHVDLFKQYGVPATEVMSLYDMPKMPEAVSPASMGGGYGQPTAVSPASMGGGYGQPTAVSPASIGSGYGYPSAVSPASMGSGYGYPSAVSPASMGGGYGQPTAVSPASMGGGYGYPSAVSPAEDMEWCPPVTLPWGAPSYGWGPQAVSPAEMGPQGGYGYHDPSMVSPANMGPQGGYGYHDPSMVSPANMGPQGGYGYYDPSMVSPANMGPQGGYGYHDPSMVSPANMGPQGGYGYYDPSMVSPANMGPQGGYGYYDPSMVSPANMGPQGGYGYMGGGQMAPVVAGASTGKKNCNCGCHEKREDEVDQFEEENVLSASPSKSAPPRKTAKKVVVRQTRTVKPKRRGSLPWINR
ncbi:LysM peptidoglycan-binding domain-containing protein [Paenibacillus sp. CF384]|uniref:LysM peptidoglycan-binding domain-containing protein n=1 Tax=Paenibacillus sp. CF384 TaxID=1884382 RepID=UPI00089D0E2E|nr:LysM peptidoglycan-binding domain-containing protein [Paenibacillus sp. CF384]SDX41114.1 LysM repeat-containing protein [Paenibacillus sp. CF384]